MSIINLGTPAQPASKYQVDYLMILFNDCGFTLNSRNVWLSNEFHLSLDYFKSNGLNGLTLREASLVIKRLKEIRGDKT